MPTMMPTPDITKPQSASAVLAAPLVAPEESTAKRGFIAEAVAKGAEGQAVQAMFSIAHKDVVVSSSRG